MSLEDEIEVILLELKVYFDVNNQSICSQICSTQQFKLEAESRDNWNGGQTGYRLTLFLTRTLFHKILDEKEKYQTSVLDQINKFHDHGDSDNGPNDFIECISLAISKSGAPEKYVPKDVEDRIWETPGIKTFISHRDTYKKEVTEFASQLSEVGFVPFVAHESIKPMVEWEPEIFNAMNSMELFIIYHKSTYHESSYCDQEIGYALAKGVPIVTLLLERDYELSGFVKKVQALKVEGKSAKDLAQLVNDKVWELGNFKAAQIKSLIDSLIKSESFIATSELLPKITPILFDLDKNTISQLIDAYNENDQIHHYGNNKVKRPFIDALEQISDDYKFDTIKRRFVNINAVPF